MLEEEEETSLICNKKVDFDAIKSWENHNKVLNDSLWLARFYVTFSSVMMFFNISRRSIWILFAREFETRESYLFFNFFVFVFVFVFCCTHNRN